MKYVYEVGQIVEIVYSKHGHMFEIGEHVRVKNFLPNGCIDSCEHLDGSDYWFVAEDEVRHIQGGLQ